MDRPCDTEEPDACAVASFEQYQKARRQYRNVIELAPHRIAKQQVDHDLAHALARAFKSTEAAGKYDDDKEPA